MTNRDLTIQEDFSKYNQYSAVDAIKKMNETNDFDRLKEKYLGHRFSTIEDLENGNYKPPVRQELRDLKNNLIGVKFSAVPTTPPPQEPVLPMKDKLHIPHKDRKPTFHKWATLRQSLFHFAMPTILIGLAVIGTSARV